MSLVWGVAQQREISVRQAIQTLSYATRSNSRCFLFPFRRIPGSKCVRILKLITLSTHDPPLTGNAVCWASSHELQGSYRVVSHVSQTHPWRYATHQIRLRNTLHQAGNTVFSAWLGPTHEQIGLPAHFRIRNWQVNAVCWARCLQGS